MKIDKKKLIIIGSVIAVILLTVIIGVSVSSCNKQNEGDFPGVELIIDNKDDTFSDTSSYDEETKKLDITLENRIEASEYCPIDYSIVVPDWESLPDFYYEELGGNEEFKINKEWVFLNNDNNFNFHTRAFISEDKNVYLFVAEYLGNIKFPMGAQLGLNSHSKALETIGHIEDGLIAQYKFEDFGPNWTEEELIYEGGSIEKWRFLNGFYTSLGPIDTDLTARGYCLLGYEVPIVVYAYDGSKNQVHAKDLDELTLNMINSIIVTPENN